MLQMLKEILQNKIVKLPVYDFVTHSRLIARFFHSIPVFHLDTNLLSRPLTSCLPPPAFRKSNEFITVYPADVVLFEGILAFYFKEIRDLFDMKLFVDTDPDTRLSKRVIRDVKGVSLFEFPHF